MPYLAKYSTINGKWSSVLTCFTTCRFNLTFVKWGKYHSQLASEQHLLKGYQAKSLENIYDKGQQWRYTRQVYRQIMYVKFPHNGMRKVLNTTVSSVQGFFPRTNILTRQMFTVTLQINCPRKSVSTKWKWLDIMYSVFLVLYYLLFTAGFAGLLLKILTADLCPKLDWSILLCAINKINQFY